MLLWAKSIACYVIAVSLLMGILPEGNHKKYVKFFTGIILSLLLLSPIMKFNSFDTLLANYYREGVAKVLDEQRNQLEGVEQQHLEKIIEQTVSVMGYSLRNVVYEKKSGEIAKLIVYVKEENKVEKTAKSEQNNKRSDAKPQKSEENNKKPEEKVKVSQSDNQKDKKHFFKNRKNKNRGNKKPE